MAELLANVCEALSLILHTVEDKEKNSTFSKDKLKIKCLVSSPSYFLIGKLPKSCAATSMISYLQHKEISYLFFYHGRSDDGRFLLQLWLNIIFNIHCPK